MPNFFEVDLSDYPLPDDTDLVVPIQQVLDHVRLVSELDSARSICINGVRHYHLAVAGNLTFLNLYNDTPEKVLLVFWSIVSFTVLRPEESVLHTYALRDTLDSVLGHIEVEELSAFGIHRKHLEEKYLKGDHLRLNLVAPAFVRPSPNTRFVNKTAQKIRLFQVTRACEYHREPHRDLSVLRAATQPSCPQLPTE